MQNKQKETETPEPSKKKRNYFKIILKGILSIIVIFILLNIILYGLLSIPSVQQKVLGFAVGKIKDITKTEVRIDEIRLSLFNNVHLKGVYIEDLAKDTLAYAGNLDVSLSPLELLKNKLLIKSIDLDDFNINISQETPDSDFNFQFMIDAFAGDTTVTDTTSSSLMIDIQSINLTNGKLKYNVLSEPVTPAEFNASHINISDLNAEMKLPSVDVMNFESTVSSLSFKEQSGLIVQNAKAEITSNKTTFFVKDLELNLPHSALKVPAAQYNLLTDVFQLTSDRSTLSASDLLPFMRDLKHLDQDITLQTNISGKLPAIKIDSLFVTYGTQAELTGNASISDYSRYDIADLEVNINNFRIEPDVITDFAKIGDSTFVAPDMLKTMGTIRLEGKLQGRLNDINIKAEAWAKQGAMQLVAKASTDTTFENFSTKAKLQTQNFNLGSLLEMPELGRLSGDIDLVASQSARQSLTADAKGKIISVQYDSISYNNIPFTAYYNSSKMGGWLKADLPQGKVEAKVDMTQDNNPVIDMDVDVEQLKVDAFYPIEGWHNTELTMHMAGKIKGIDLKNIQADVVVDSLKFSHDSLTFETDRITLQAGISDSAKNYISLNSSLLKADITGEYDFISLSDEFSNVMHAYLPGLFKRTLNPRPGKNNFDINILVQNTEKLGRVLDLPVDVIDPLTIKGNINTIDNKLNLAANIPRLKYGDDIGITRTTFNVASSDSAMNVIAKSNLKLDSGNIGLNLNSGIASDTINMTLNVKRDSTDMDVEAQLKALAHFEFNAKDELVSNLQLSPTSLDIGKLNLSLLPAHIRNEGNRTSISNFGFMVGDGRVANKYFGVDGIISDQKQDTLNISFSNSDLGYLLQAFDINNMGAVANGDIRIASVLDKPELYTDNMSLSDIVIFNDTLGTLNAKSLWSESVGAIRFDATLQKNSNMAKSTVSGLVYPQEETLDLKVDLDRLSLAWVQPFMSDMLNRASGSISTGLTVTGKIDAPEVKGWLGVNDAYLGIDYTNVTYHISDTIEITPEKVGFNELIVEDPYKNKARVNATLTHQGFQNMKYTLQANLNNFMVLNTASRTDSLFYGTVYASGNVDIKGSDDLIDIDMTIRNGKNSSLNVQIPQTSEASVYQSIVYINTPVDETKKAEETEPESTLPLKLKVNLTTTPDLTLGVVINPLTGDNMQVKGNGLIEFSYDMRSEDMRAIGNYALTDGFVKLRLQNLATIEFKIREGSQLVFNGDPMQTRFDITAFKRVRADLTTLDAGFGSDQYNSPRVYVDCILGIKGNIDKMDLTYDISLPEASDDIQQRVRAMVSTNEQKVKQFAYLVALGSFYPQGSTDLTGITQGLLTNVATGAIGTVLNSALGKVIGGDWEVGANIASDDGTFGNMDMTVSLSRKFLDNKLEFNTNLGYRTDQTNSDQLIGDFDLGYALTRSIKLKVFNKTNDRYYKQAPTTQGIGIVYTKEAKTMKELFRFVRKKRNRTQSQQTTTR